MGTKGPQGSDSDGAGSLSDEDVLSDLDSILGESPKASPAPEAPPVEETRYEATREEIDHQTTQELIIALPSILRIFGRELRLTRRQGPSGKARSSGSWTTTESESTTSQAIIELHASLAPILDRYGEVHLRVKIDGLYIGGERVLEISPREDRALFRLFQHGVRQFSFGQGLSLDELESFVEVLTTDPDTFDQIEEDISTLLVDQEFESIHFVVVDTFTEGGIGGAASQHRAADLAELVSAALRETISTQPAVVDGGQGGTVRFLAADVTFLEQHDIGALLTSLRSQTSDDVEQARPDEELEALGGEVKQAMVRWTPWLPRSVLGALDGSTAEEADALYRLLGSHLLGDAQHYGLASIKRELVAIGRWLDECGEDDERSASVTNAVFSPRLARIALTALRTGETEGELVAIDVFRRLTPGDRGKTLVDTCRLPAGPARASAITSLLRRPRPALEVVLDNFLSFDVSAARAVLGALSDATEDETEAIGVFQVALVFPDAGVRAESLGWLMQNAGDRAAAALSEALRDEDATVRRVALFLILDRRPTYGGAIVKTWFGSPFVKKLPLDEKRLAACSLAALSGDSVLPMFRKLVRKLNITGDSNVDEIRAASVAALGMLNDAESEERIAKLAKSRICGQTLQEEAKHVASALSRGRLPYSEPLLQLRETAVDAGLADEVVPDRRDMPTVPARPASAPAPSSSSAPTSPPQRRSAMPIEPAPAGQVTASSSPEPPETLIEELLQSYSFDDLPSAVPLQTREEPSKDE